MQQGRPLFQHGRFPPSSFTVLLGHAFRLARPLPEPLGIHSSGGWSRVRRRNQIDREMGEFMEVVCSVLWQDVRDVQGWWCLGRLTLVDKVDNHEGMVAWTRRGHRAASAAGEIVDKRQTFASDLLLDNHTESFLRCRRRSNGAAGVWRTCIVAGASTATPRTLFVLHTSA
jgi:hypothetical protein